MEIILERNKEIAVLQPVGRLDIAASREFMARADELLDAGERRVVVDFARTEYIDGAGMRVLLVMAKKLTGLGGGLTLCALSEPVSRALEVAGFALRFSTTPSIEVAIQQINVAEAVHRISERAASLLSVAEERDLAAEAEQEEKDVK